jgi:Raf kinase inhibitor-like YbhB/YbcL family protein
MLEHVPHWLGQLMTNLRAGHDRLVIAHAGLAIGDGRIDLTSPAFAAGARLPDRFTADGDGVSPPLVWGELPNGTAALALIVEDPDAPAPNPLVHALVWNIAPSEHRLAEGVIEDGRAPGAVGRNSYGRTDWLPPDPPTGHGTHDYVFQLFALSAALALHEAAGRTDLVVAMEGLVLGAGLLVGTYSRGEPAAAGAPTMATAPLS